MRPRSGDPTRVLLVLALLGIRTALAVDPQRPIAELAHRVWDSRSGVPADIWALAQTTDGYLWVGSRRGLYRFDGVQFQKFEPESGAQLPSHDIRSLFAAPGDRLWIGYRRGGASVLEANKLTNYKSADGFPEGAVKGFVQDRQGRIWAASSSGLAYFEGSRWHVVGSESGFPDSGAQAILRDHLGALWVAGEHHIAVLSPHASKFELADESYRGQVNALAESPDGTIWMAETTRAVRPLKGPGGRIPAGPSKDDCQERFPDTWQTEPRCRRPDDLEVRVGSVAILFDQSGSFWITTVGDGLRRAPHPSQLAKEPIGQFSSTLEQFTSKDGLSSDVAWAILEDREGCIWVASRNGIDQFRNRVLTTVDLGPSVQGPSIVADSDGYVIGRDSAHLFRFHDALSRVDVTNENNDVHWLYRDPFGSTWGITFQFGCRFVGNQCATRFDAPGETRLSNRPWRLAVDGDHRLWGYATGEGLYELENGRWARSHTALKGAEPSTEYTDPAGYVWFGFLDGRVLTLNEGRVRIYSSEDGLNVGAIKAIYTSGTNIWVGGANGVVISRGTRFTPVLPYDAAAFGSVSGIVSADDGSLWLNESRGIVRVSPSEVSAIILDGSHLAHYDLLGSPDGLAGTTEQFVSPTAIRGTDGRLWFTTTNGAAWVDPRHLYRNELPAPVVIQSIVADGRTVAPSSALALPAGTRNLQITYAGLSFSVPERVQFRYRLQGLDDDWQSAGTRRAAYYTKLPAGSYNFQVIASNDAGVWNEAGASLLFRVIPAWYQTWWFYALCALFALAALAAVLQLRIGQVRAAANRLLEARLSERDRIARELHDTILQSFHGLLLHLQAAYQLLPTSPDKAKQTLAVAIDGAFEAATEGRDAVQELRVSALAGSDLAAAIKALGDELAAATTEHAPHLRVDVTGAPQALRPSVRDEVYRIAGESLRNAFRHAAATRIEVDLCYDEWQLRLRIRDDGRGIDPRFLREDARTGHYGIHGMRERAKLMDASLAVWSAPNSGTELELCIPASSAYVRSRVAGRWRSVRSLFVRRAPAES